jgi:hypothetical protein
MKNRITSSIVLTLSLLLALVTLPLTAQAQQKLKPIGDTGEITLGLNQILRLTVAATDLNGDGAAVIIRFGKATYMPLGCNSEGVCKHSLSTQSLSSPIRLDPGEAASMDITSNLPVRAIVISSNPNVRLNALIIDATTGNVIDSFDFFVGKGGAT